MGGAIGLMMSDGSSGFPFTRMNPPGAVAAVNPVADGIILHAEWQEGKCGLQKREEFKEASRERERHEFAKGSTDVAFTSF